MNIEIRNKIRKIKPLYNFAQYLILLDSYIFYKKFCHGSNNIERIKELKESQKGKRCFIVGNGPSLKMQDLDILSYEDCFASNLIFKVFGNTKWRPKYYIVLDRYAKTDGILDDIKLEYLFIGDYYWKNRGMKNENAICVHARRAIGNEEVKFSQEVDKVLYCNYTVTHAMLQLAIYMGYTEIYLLGMDHSYALSYDDKGNVIEDKSIDSHVFKDDNPKDVIANIEGMNKAYIASRKYAEAHGIKIINVTRGGKLEWFERLNLEEVL